jgi:2-methylisocitrate lyase-like PEP mutase family enzyme
MNKPGILKARLETGEIISAPGIYDMISLLIADQVGFDAVYASGYWNIASALGEPDAGIAGYRDFETMFRRYAQRSAAPVIADADTGFGGIANIDHAVRGYQRLGIAAMQIEDQVFPKKCGHSAVSKVVSCGEMVTRIKTADAARDDMLIIARTDARLSEGLDKALDRLKTYGDAGADVLFLEAPANVDEIAVAAQTLGKPLMINAAHGGRTPVLSPAVYQDLGVAIAIYPAGAPLSAARAVQSFYAGLKVAKVNADMSGMFDFAKMSRMLGLDDIAALEARFEG